MSTGGVFAGAPMVALAENVKSSMANPCAFPAGSVISQTIQSAAPGGQSPMARLLTLRLVWLAGVVPSTATPPVADGTVGKLTFNAGIRAVKLVEKAAAAVGSIR